MATRILDTTRGLSDLHSLMFAGGSLSSRVNSANDASLNLTNSGTLEFWVYLTGNLITNVQIAGQGTTTNTVFGVFVVTGTKFEARVGNGSSVITVQSTTILALNTLYHVVFTYDVADSGGTARLYVNGTQESTGTIGTGISLPANKTFSVGQLFTNVTTTRALVGKVDDVRLYSRAITAGEVTSRYAGASIGTTGLLIDWKMDAGFGTGVSDTSGNNLHGTIQSTSLVTWDNKLVNF